MPCANGIWSVGRRNWNEDFEMPTDDRNRTGHFGADAALLGVAVLITYSPQNGVILLVMAFLISPMGLPLAAIWLLGKVQSLKFAIQDWVYS